MALSLSAERLSHLRALAAQYPSADAAISEAAALRAKLTLPKGIVHIISDIHGEDAKLRHVINNASGALRQLVDEVLGDRLDAAEMDRFLAILYYPREAIDEFSHEIVAGGGRQEWIYLVLTLQFDIIRALRKTYRRDRFERLVDPAYRELFLEMASAHRPAYIQEMLAGLARHDKDWGAVRSAARLIRNLTCEELLVLGDVGDRGPRVDRVIEALMRQPTCNVIWGNHDMLWIGSALGHEACMLTTLRFSIRYRVAAQLEEGYGIPRLPLERLIQQCYADDPAERFLAKGEGLRDPLSVARMQKAVSIMQFKAEGQMFERHPEWNLAHRRLLHRIDFKDGTVEVDGFRHKLLDTHLPTIDPKEPYAYSPEEAECIDRMKNSFVHSQKLREHMEWLVRRGGMWTTRDEVLLFHACVPVDETGTPLSVSVEGREVAGRELMDALGSIVRRAVRKRWFGIDSDADWLWYLWGGPRSPLFGKDKLATFETHFVADKATHKEQKNPYFDLMHDAGFIKRIGTLFGCGEDVLVVNGHVPVKIEKGEQPIKRGGNAITIDGAFSQAYGDRGYTLILRPDRIDLAEHSSFDGVAKVVEHGADIVPKMTTVRRFDKPRAIGDTSEGVQVRAMIQDLEELVRAFQEGFVAEAR